MTSVIDAYLEADAPVRAELFRKFRAALASLKADHQDALADEYARRAVSPLLDFAMLTALGKERIPSGESANTLRIAVLGGPTTTQLVQALGIFLWAENIDAVLYQCDYGLFRQEIMIAGSGLDQFRPDIVFLANDARDILHFPNLDADSVEVDNLFHQEAEEWASLWEDARRKWNCTIIQNSLALPGYPALGGFAGRYPASPTAFTDSLNQYFRTTAPGHVLIHDVQLLIDDVGKRQWFDPRFYLEAKMPCGLESIVPYAHSAAALIRAIRGKSKKVLVLDLDNTVWGGVVGDLGPEGIAVGQGSGLGEAFLAFQAWAKALHARGILLAVCSKNDDHRAREPFEKRQDMILKLDHFVAFRANWNDKPGNIRQIAETINLGLDSFVFADDNPAERAIVRRVLPEVSVPDMPEDPASYPEAVSLHRYFETVSYTAEDSRRSQYYRDNEMRSALASQGGGDLDSFLQSLDMVAVCQPVCPLNIQRVTQLLNKSNQFNLTTRRYTQAEIEGIADGSGWRTLTLSLRDRCGDNGLISILFFQVADDVMIIDTWLMSCRVLQRGVESFALSKTVAIAIESGCHFLEGSYIPTAKNEMVREHYDRLGFSRLSTEGDVTRYRLATEGYTAPPSYIREES